MDAVCSTSSTNALLKSCPGVAQRQVAAWELGEARLLERGEGVHSQPWRFSSQPQLPLAPCARGAILAPREAVAVRDQTLRWRVSAGRAKSPQSTRWPLEKFRPRPELRAVRKQRKLARSALFDQGSGTCDRPCPANHQDSSPSKATKGSRTQVPPWKR
jgi:hypothetical protein